MDAKVKEILALGRELEDGQRRLGGMIRALFNEPMTSAEAIEPREKPEPTTDIEEELTGEKKKRKPNPNVEPWYGWWLEGYAEVTEDEVPYKEGTKDFVQLAALMKHEKIKAWLHEEEKGERRWKKAVEHYFTSEIATYSFADFCARFTTFYKSPLDRFNKPIEGEVSEQKASLWR